MDKEQAALVLAKVKEGGWSNDPWRDSKQNDAVEAAEWWLVEARKARDSGMANQNLLEIISLSEGRNENQEIYPASPRLQETIEKERLPVPQELDPDVPQMPVDLTACDDRTIRRLHGVFHAYMSRTMYLLGLQSSDLEAAKTAHREAYEKAFLAVDRIDDTGGKKLRDIIEMEANLSPDVKMWSDRVKNHSINVNMLKTNVEIYRGHVERLSREWTMRTDEARFNGA